MTAPPTFLGSLASLRDRVGSSPTDAFVLLGYYAPGDGGGGPPFSWTSDVTSPDDGGAVVVPIEPIRTGAWKRAIEGICNVRWWGAMGDDAQDDAPFFQKAIDFAKAAAYSVFETGKTVFVPTGRYRLVIPSASVPALAITQNNVILEGEGGPPSGGSYLRIEGAQGGVGAGVLIEIAGAPKASGSYSELRNLTIVGDVNVTPQDLVVVHAAQVSIASCYLVHCKRWGLLIESGAVGTPEILGVSLLPNGTYVGSNFWRLINPQWHECGDWQNGTGQALDGAAVLVHGSDTNGGVCIGGQAIDCNVSYADNSLGGATWVGCYSQTSKLGYTSGTNISTWVGCYSEDQTPCFFPPGSTPMVVGGTLASFASPSQRIGCNNAALAFKRVDADGNAYIANVPGIYSSALDYGRTAAPSAAVPSPVTTQWANTWQLNGYGALAFQQNSWRWIHYKNGALNTQTDFVYGGPWGQTDVGSPRGEGLPMIPNPLMNTLRQWNYKQTITIPTGSVTVYCNGGLVDAGAIWPGFCDSPTIFWPNAETRMLVSLEFSDLVALESSAMTVRGYAFVDELGGGRNAAVRIVNPGAETAVTIVWNFSAFVANGDAGP